MPSTFLNGGLSKAVLLQELRRNAVSLNELAERLLASDLFTTSPIATQVSLVERSVAELGIVGEPTISKIYARAEELGLRLCPLELGPFLRLQYLDQPEGDNGQPSRQHRAPAGSLTIASPPVSDDDDFPKGLYLRRIQGVLWLRGYCSGADHVWDAEDRFVFMRG